MKMTMTPKSKMRLAQVLVNNKAWPLVIIGAAVRDLPPAAVIPAGISERELYLDMDISEAGEFWVIDGLDKLSESEQEKFVGLLKDRRVGGRKIPSGVQIVIPVGRRGRLSPQILRLCLVWEI